MLSFVYGDSRLPASSAATGEKPMPDSATSFRPIPESEIHPDVAGLLKPGEQVYWQEQPPRKSLLFPMVVVVAILGGIAWQEGLIEDPGALIKDASMPALLLLGLIPIVLIGGFIGVHYYRHDATLYALTSQRVLRTFKGEVAQQATPAKLRLASPRPGSVRWHNADFPPSSEDRGRHGFARVQDGLAVHQLLDDWQQTRVRQVDERVAVSSASFRDHARRADADAAAAPTSPGAAASASIRRIEHPTCGFSLDVPAEWDARVGQEHEGPLRILGITLLKRVVRPARLEPLQPGDTSPWNRLTIRGGPSTGISLRVNPRRMYSEDEVLDDRWGERLGVEGKFLERDIDIAGFRGFAAVRELPAGSSPMGFESVPLPVVSKQWWLSGHGVDLELQGIAPNDSAPLQQTVDLAVASLRPDD